MRMICLVNYDTKSVTAYSLCKRSLIEEETFFINGESSLTHYDINVSWRRFKKELQKKGFTFANLKNGY